MTNEELLKVIEEAKASGATRLNLSFKQLTALPPEICQLQNLTELNLSGNPLTSLPQGMKCLTKLSVLTLRNNQLTEVPSEIFQLTSLTELCLNDNQLASLPPEISQLTNLTVLDLSGNQLKQLPSEIAKLTSLAKLELWNNQLAKLPIEIFQLRTLEKLTLTENPLRQVPPAIRQLVNLKELYIGKCQLTQLPLELFQLTKLERLGLWENQLREVPSEISRLSDLSYLNLSGNRLKKLPEGFCNLKKLTALYLTSNQLASLTQELFQLTRLTKLDFNGNQLARLPQDIGQLTNLTELHLNRNLLHELPDEIGQLTQLKILDLGGNRLASLPIKIGQLINLTKLFLWENQLTQLPPTLIQLSKLTTLDLWANPLMSPPMEIVERGLEGISQYFAELEKGDQSLNEVKIILVGEGGAGKTSLVKQLLGQKFDPKEDTTHGINIRNWQPDTGSKQIKVNLWDFGGQVIMHATHQFFLSKRSLYVLVLDGRREERPEYWLRHIKTFGGDSPVLIVQNKQDSFSPSTLNRPFLREKYPIIHDFYPTSCNTGVGIDTFRAALISKLAHVEMIETRWPKSWFRVKEQLEQMQDQYISWDRYETLCVDADITKETDQNVLVDFLNDLGVAVHFKQTELNDVQVLNPLWVTTAVYKIITADEVVDSGGILYTARLKEILTQQNKQEYFYPKKTHKYILDLMKQFELCYCLDKGRMLIPQLLPVEERNFTFDYTKSLQFVLHYDDFLPPSVMPRFIVKSHKDIQDGLRWRTGVVLENQESQSLAVVKADNEARRISIAVSGPQRHVYFAVILLFFREINASFEQLKVTELMPMPDAPEITANLKTLLKHVQLHREDYLPDGSDKEYNVKELLRPLQLDDEHDDWHKVLDILLKSSATPMKDELSWVDRLNKIFDLKPNWNGMGVNFNALLEELRDMLKRRKTKQREHEEDEE